LGESAGSGCRGPDIICPGRADGGTGRDGITGPRFTNGGAMGWPVARGGRNGNAGRTGAAGGSATGATSFGASEATGAGSTLAAGRAGSGAAAAAGAACSGCFCALCCHASGSAPVCPSVRASGCPVSCSAAGSDECSANAPAATLRRSCSATSSSSELECVFLSVTPNSGNRSRMMLGLTSSSRASSLMRILLIFITPEPATSAPGT
jgi:hypothetical protein